MSNVVPLRAKSYAPGSQMGQLDRLDAPIIKDIYHLGGRASLYLLALVLGNQLRQRVAPTKPATEGVLSLLSVLGVIRTENSPSIRTNLTAGDKLPWAYTWPHVPYGDLHLLLGEHLATSGRSPEYGETWLQVWQELIPNEVTAYLQHQLKIHQFSDVFLDELTPFLLPTESTYSLGHWRYACWATVRSMASVSLQHPGNVELLKFTLRNDLPRRLLIAAESPGEKFCFSPSRSISENMLTIVFSTIATRLGDNFWKSPPSLEFL